MQALAAALRSAARGTGQLALVYGEAGIGKTALLEYFTRASGQGRRLWGACDSLHTPRPLGPLYDVANDAGAALREALEAGASSSVLFPAVLDELGRQPPVTAVLEDLHWADEATLDLVKFLGRRIHRVPALLVLTYRDDELGARHPLRIVLGDLATSGAVRRMVLPRLSVAAVRTLAANEPLDAEALHRQTGGNPFFVTEALASGAAGIPPTVRDAVLARAARLSPSGRAALEAAAVIGTTVEPWILSALVTDVGSATEECIASGMLQSQGELLGFRHELARQAILQTIAAPRLRALHAVVLRALASSPTATPELARLAHHGEGAADTAAVLTHAPAAAARAAAVGAHRQAADQYARALRFADMAAPSHRAQLLDAYAGECAILDRVDEAIAARRKAVDIYREVGHQAREGETLAALALLLVRAGRNAEAEAASRRATRTLRALPPGPPLARAYRMQAHLRMLNRDRAEAVRWGRKAIALAERLGEQETRIAAYNVLGSAMLVYGDERGRAHLERSLGLAREAGLHDLVANAFSNLGSACGEIYRFADADRYLSDGVEYAAEHDLDHAHGYMLSWLALIRLYQGRWTEAGDIAGTLIQSAHVAAISRIMALVALGRLQARRGEPGATAALDEALELASGTQTLQRLAPVRAARAEAAWLVDDRQRARAEARAIWELAVRHRHPWHTGELGYWRWRTGERVRLPRWSARPFALHIEGDWRRAAAAWERLGCPTSGRAPWPMVTRWHASPRSRSSIGLALGLTWTAFDSAFAPTASDAFLAVRGRAPARTPTA